MAECRAAPGSRRFRVGPGVLALLAVAACTPPPSPGADAAMPTPPRQGRFGSLRDFVLFERPPARSGAPRTWFFLDRFEVTRADWSGFARSTAGSAVAARADAAAEDAALPVGLVDLTQARAFAAWRFARLPRLDEWAFATADDGRYRFPWGSRVDATRANTGELGLGMPTPVGTFESGRRAHSWPYDLVGNVSEWTETVPTAWCTEVVLSTDAAVRDFEADQARLVRWLFTALFVEGPADREWVRRVRLRADRRHLEAAEVVEMSWSFAEGRRQALRASGLALWQLPGGVLPAVFAAAGAGAEAPREVAGADFQSSMDRTRLVETVPAGDRRLRTGLRLCTTPVELLVALATAGVEPSNEDYEQLRRFVARDRHAAVLAAAWPEVLRRVGGAVPDTALGRWLAANLPLPAGTAPRRGS